MSIDQRHTQIREKAGLEESRLNQEFIGFLQKWSTPLMAVIAIAALGYVGLGKLKEQRVAKIDAAYREFQEVSLGGTLNASPDSLLNVASAYEDVPGVSILARLGAADALMQAVRTGLRPGAVLTPEGVPESTDDLLSEADRAAYLDRAAAAYGQVLSRTEPVAGQEVHTIASLYGLATVDVARGDFPSAKVHLERVKTLATSADFPLHVQIATERLAALDNAESVPALISQSELPKPPEPPVPEPVAVPTLEAPTEAPDASLPEAVAPPASNESAVEGDPKPASADDPK